MRPCRSSRATSRRVFVVFVLVLRVFVIKIYCLQFFWGVLVVVVFCSFAFFVFFFWGGGGLGDFGCFRFLFSSFRVGEGLVAGVFLGVLGDGSSRFGVASVFARWVVSWNIQVGVCVVQIYIYIGIMCSCVLFDPFQPLNQDTQKENVRFSACLTSSNMCRGQKPFFGTRWQGRSSTIGPFT